MKNFIQDGDTIVVTAPSGGIASGDIVNIGAMSGVAAISGAEGEDVVVNLEGVYEVPKNTSLAITAGDEVYVHTATGKVTKTSTDKSLGIAFADAASNDETVIVKLVAKKGDINGTLAQAATVAAITTAAATDLTTTEALANQLKTTVNNILTELKAAGLMA